MKADGVPQFVHFLPYEGIDVGIDRRSPVSWDLYERHGAFPFTGTIHAVTYTPGPASPDAAVNLIDQARALGLGLEVIPSATLRPAFGRASTTRIDPASTDTRRGTLSMTRSSLTTGALAAHCHAVA